MDLNPTTILNRFRRPKPRTLTDRVRAGGQVAAGAGRAGAALAGEAARTVRDRAASPGSALQSGRRRALAVAGTAAGAAGAFAFWRAKQDDRPPTNIDPAPAASAVPGSQPAQTQAG